MEHFTIGTPLAGYDEQGLSETERAALDEGAEKPPSADDAAVLEEILAEDNDADERRPFIPQMEVRPVENYEARLGEIEAQKAAVRRQREDGDLDFDEAERRLDALADQRTDLMLQQRDAVRAYQHNSAAAQEDWAFEVRSFMRGHTEYEESQVLWGALDNEVKRLANERDERGNYINGDKDARWFLDEAHKNVARVRRAAMADDEREGEDQPAERMSFKELNQLEGLDLEDALSRLPPDQVEAYLRGQ